MDQLGIISIFSPNGKYKLHTSEDELRMSHWVYSPVITDKSGLCQIFSLRNSTYDLRYFEFLDDLIILKLFKYPDAEKAICLELDLQQLNGRIENGITLPLGKLIDVLLK